MTRSGGPSDSHPPSGAAGTPLQLDLAAGWDAVTTPRTRAALESTVLPQYLPRQRWFGAKSRAIRGCRIDDWVALTPHSGLVFCTVSTDEAGAEAGTYVIPVALAAGSDAQRIARTAPNAVLCPVGSDAGAGALYDAVANDASCLALYELVEHGARRRGARGVVQGSAGRELEAAAAPAGGWPVSRLGAEQSNTSIVFGDRFILKLFRRVVPGPQPDCEVTRYLTEETTFSGVPAFAGLAEYQEGATPPASVAMLQRMVPNEGDGWRWVLEELDRIQEQALRQGPPPPAPRAAPLDWIDAGDAGSSRDVDPLFALSRQAAAALGTRTGELHLALARPTDDPAFKPEPITAASRAQLASDIARSAAASFDLLGQVQPRLPDELAEVATRALKLRDRVGERLERLQHLTLEGFKIRIHGDYHLGQVLRTGGDFVIIDFEGEPARPLIERRAKQSPLRDVAGMLRSFSYAAQAALMNRGARQPSDAQRLVPFAQAWERSVCGEFLRAYLRTVADSRLIPADRNALATLLESYLLEKVLYELRYELDNRPSWVRLPLAGLLDLELAGETAG